jgi:hypothetical protein
LRGEIKISFQIGGVHHDDDHGGRGDLGQAVEKNVAADLFIQGLRAEAVSARQIEHGDGQIGRPARQPPFLAFDGDAGVIAHARAQSGQGVEQGRFARIGIAAENGEEARGPGRRRADGGDGRRHAGSGVRFLWRKSMVGCFHQVW